jgi:hypothetical protein
VTWDKNNSIATIKEEDESNMNKTSGSKSEIW